jgi:hypothetical protein
MSFSIDDEWMQYLSTQNSSSCVGGLLNKSSNPVKLKIVEEPNIINNSIVPKCDELYISTKTKVLFLNQEIDINNVFWNIPIIEYWKPNSGVIKKQMKIVSKTPEEYEEIQERLKKVSYYTENIIKQIKNNNKMINKHMILIKE